MKTAQNLRCFSRGGTPIYGTITALLYTAAHTFAIRDAGSLQSPCFLPRRARTRTQT